ncbi:hypothetical protein E3P86_02093 [Wallemia ichthyophaga]|uniref:NAD-dependent epimerase/dehydratase domain-containing protein n=1 Tax=Wallemia ichthyophaga TaxID=245174 RepID=A0A4T0J6A0_WALIC|nr:hypothetical protein E3P86_02093 [Wallemia ichthyophaga]
MVVRGVTPTVMQLAPTVHCDDDKAFVHILNNSTLTHWKAVYVNLITWSAVHPRDFASLYRLAFEAARKGKSIVYHGVDECRYIGFDRTRKELGWNPTQVDLLSDIEHNYAA